MEVSQSKGNLGGKKFSLVFREHAHLDQVAEELSSLDKFHEEVDPEFVLEDVLHVNQEGVVDLAKDVFLKLDVFHLLVFQNNIFADALHRVELLCGRVFHQEHLSESAFANHLADDEVLKGGWLCLVSCEHSLRTASHGLTHFGVSVGHLGLR